MFLIAASPEHTPDERALRLELALLPPLWGLVVEYFSLAERWDRRNVFLAPGPWDWGAVIMDALEDVRQMDILMRFLSMAGRDAVVTKDISNRKIQRRFNGIYPNDPDNFLTSELGALLTVIYKVDDVGAFALVEEFGTIWPKYLCFAVKHSAVRILSYALKNKGDIISVIHTAIMDENIEVLEALKCDKLGAVLENTAMLYSEAVFANKLAAVKWLSANIPPGCRCVSKYGDAKDVIASPEMLEHLISVGVGCVPLMGAVARGGTKSMMVRVLKIFDKCTIVDAANTVNDAAGRPDDDPAILQLLVAVGFPIPGVETGWGPTIQAWIRSARLNAE